MGFDCELTYIENEKELKFTSLDEITNMEFDFFITNSNKMTLDYEMNFISPDELNELN